MIPNIRSAIEAIIANLLAGSHVAHGAIVLTAPADDPDGPKYWIAIVTDKASAYAFQWSLDNRWYFGGESYTDNQVALRSLDLPADVEQVRSMMSGDIESWQMLDRGELGLVLVPFGWTSFMRARASEGEQSPVPGLRDTGEDQKFWTCPVFSQFWIYNPVHRRLETA